MDAENENEQPISSSASSSNSSSSSNLLVNLPMLPMLQSHDDEDLEAQEQMPPHPPSTPPPSLSLVSNQQHLSQQQAAASSPAAEQQQQLQQHLPTEMSPLLFNNNTTPPPSSSSSSSSSSSHNHQLHQHFQHSEHHYHHQHHHQYHHQQQQHEQQLQQHSSPPSPTQQPPQQQLQLQQQPQQQEFSAEDDDEDIADSIDASAIDANDQQQAAIVANVVNLNVDVASTSQQREQRDVQPERSQTVDVAVGVVSATNEPHLLPPPQLPLSLPREEFKRHHQLHSSSSQFPRSHHHYHSSTGCCNNIFSGSNANNNNNSNIMFTNNDNDGEPQTSNTSQHHQHQAVDRLKMLYPNVNENETPLPRCWSSHDKCLAIGLSQNNLRVHYKGAGKQHNDAASVRTAHPIPPACGLYYFEVKIISKGKNGYMGIGLTAQQFRMNRLPGWDKQSYGYHGDDGNSFSSSGNGQSYGPTFTTGDIIGCCVNFVNNTCFYTKNGIDLGIAFRDLPSKLYPTVGLQTPGEEVDANFGQEPFKFDQIEDMIKQLRAETKASIYDFPMPVDQGDPTTLLHKMVSSYLVHNGYSLTAEAFAGTTGQSFSEDLSSIKNRQKILKLVMSGKMGQAIEHTLGSYPGLLENNKNLLFMLKCRQFIEMVNGSDVEFCPANNKLPINIKNVANNTTVTTQTQTTPPNQTSVIQSTKSYQNGNIKMENAAINAQDNAPNTTVISADNHQEFKNSLSIENSTVDNQPISNKSNDAVVANSYYLHDVEMENGHHANGNTCKNGNSTNFNNTLDLDEDMDVDLSPSTRKYCHGFERILEFGKELSQMGQQLEKENKMNDEDRQMLEDAFSLIAYSNPWSSPLGWQLCPSKREAVCSALNSAILESMNYPWRPPLEVCVAHASELLKVMAQASLGACAFVNIEDVFPQN